jgi:3'-phosphoadenosine 5'-phosphosulfate sulfotransferase (PAPS reductase)/FAD synthetase
MKKVDMFKMDINTGEAKFIKTDQYKNLDTLVKLDILKDWIENLIEEHTSIVDYMKNKYNDKYQYNNYYNDKGNK